MKTKINPLLQHGMVAFKGKDPRRGYYYHTVDINRLVNEKKSICFLEMADTVEKLGFEIGPHWLPEGNHKGYFSVIGLKYHGPFDNVDDIEVSPIITKIVNEGMKNKAFKSLLKQENE